LISQLCFVQQLQSFSPKTVGMAVGIVVILMSI